MKKKNLLLLLFLVTSCFFSCTNDDVKELKSDYLTYKVEFHAMMDTSSEKIIKTKSAYDNEDDYEKIKSCLSENKYDLLAKIDTSFNGNVKQYLNLFVNSMFENKKIASSPEDIMDDSSLNYNEKKCVLLALAAANTYLESVPIATKAVSKKAKCESDYQYAKALALGEALVAGGLGFFGGPISAVVSYSVVGSWELAKAELNYSRCMKQ